MIDHPLITLPLVAASILVVLINLYLGLVVSPRAPGLHSLTRWGGTAFFLMSALAQVAFAVAALLHPDDPLKSATNTWATLAIAIFQIVAITLLFAGFFLNSESALRPWGYKHQPPTT